MNDISSLLSIIENKTALLENSEKIRSLQETVRKNELRRLRRLHRKELTDSRRIVTKYKNTNKHLEETLREQHDIIVQLEDDISGHKDARTELEEVIEHLIDTRPKRKTPPTEPIKKYTKTYIKDHSHLEEIRGGTKWHVQEIGGVWNYTNYTTPPREEIRQSEIDSLLNESVFDDIFIDPESYDSLYLSSDDNLDFLDEL